MERFYGLCCSDTESDRSIVRLCHLCLCLHVLVVIVVVLVLFVYAVFVAVDWLVG